MYLTRETDYALRIIRALRDRDLHTLSDISQSERVPLSFAYKIAKKLERSEIVELFRGTSGGCRLTADLHRVTLYDLMSAVGEEIAISECMIPGSNCTWRESHGDCVVHNNLAKIQQKLEHELKNVSLLAVMSEQS